MYQRNVSGTVAAAAAAGLVTGLFGGGGGMVLVPLLGLLTTLQEDTIFPTSISIILPICIICLLVTSFQNPPDIHAAFPYLLGSIAGGYFAGKVGYRIPVLWLHRLLGIFILWGGIRYLC